MNGFDILLLALACVLVVVGMVKGLVRILIGVAALIAAFAVAVRYHTGLAERLVALDFGLEWLRLLAWLMIFLAVIIAGGLLAFLVRRLVKAAMLGWADRLGGAALGLAAAMLAAALVVLPLVAYSPGGQRWIADSLLAPYVTVITDVANRLVPDDLSERYRVRVEDLRREWSRRYVAEFDAAPPQV